MTSLAKVEKGKESMWKGGMGGLELVVHLGGKPQKPLRAQVSKRMQSFILLGKAYSFPYLRQGLKFSCLVKSFRSTGNKAGRHLSEANGS